MKTFVIVFFAFLAILVAPVTAENLMNAQSVKYVGQGYAKSICRAVVADDAGKLRRELLRYRDTLSYGYFLDIRHKSVYGSFTCNEMDLLRFADEIGAMNISGYFRGGTVTVEEYAASGE